MRAERIRDVDHGQPVRVGRGDVGVVSGDRHRGRMLERPAAGPRRRQAAVSKGGNDRRGRRPADVDDDERVPDARIRARLSREAALSGDVGVIPGDRHAVGPEEVHRVSDRAGDRRLCRVCADIDDGEAVAGPVVIAAASLRPVAILAGDERIPARDVDCRSVQQVVRRDGLSGDDRVTDVVEVDRGQPACCIRSRVRVAARRCNRGGSREHDGVADGSGEGRTRRGQSEALGHTDNPEQHDRSEQRRHAAGHPPAMSG